MTHACNHPSAEAIYPFDARGVTKGFHHAAIFGAFDSLTAGETTQFVNDHDPIPLLHQLEARYGDAISSTMTSTLYKTQQLEVFRLVLLAGKEMPEHQVVGELTVQCLEGSIEFSIGTTHEVMRAGDLKCLAGGVSHSLRAIEDSAVLVTLLLNGA
ncbi:uncharacterized protein (DUF2249 family) [Rhodoferax antarcticus]|nr:uncharacterized protein (DUF2249 family) [Rhodoferax antarcticus]